MKGRVSYYLLWIVFSSAFIGIGIDLYNKFVSGGVLHALSTFKYFTLQSNLLVLIYAFVILFCVRLSKNSFVLFMKGPLTSYIVLTGLVYLIILEPIYDLEGLERIASVFLHYVVPPLMFLWWILSEQRSYSLREVPKWLVYPVLFMVWGLFLALVEGDYLYPFFDVSQYGIYVALYILFVAIGFVSLVVLLIFINIFFIKR
jgi:hypothetical protein